MEDEVLMLWISRSFLSPAILEDGHKFASSGENIYQALRLKTEIPYPEKSLQALATLHMLCNCY